MVNNLYVYYKDDLALDKKIRYKVYDIIYDKSGYPHFLIYKDGQWLRESAKKFIPTENFNEQNPKVGKLCKNVFSKEEDITPNKKISFDLVFGGFKQRNIK